MTDSDSNLYARQGTWYVRTQVQGREIRRSLHTKSKDIARERMAVILAAVPTLDIANLPLRQFTLYVRSSAESARGQTVYFLQAEAGGPIKIGRSVNAHARIRDLQVGSGQRLRLLAAIPAPPEIEKMLHVRFAKERVHREWFRPSGRLRRLISNLAGTPIGTVASGLQGEVAADQRLTC